MWLWTDRPTDALGRPARSATRPSTTRASSAPSATPGGRSATRGKITRRLAIAALMAGSFALGMADPLWSAMPWNN
jgi:hypothetical protein